MTLEQIAENIYPEDRMMAAVTATCHPKLVDMVIEGKRKHLKGKGKVIWRFLLKAANENIKCYANKERYSQAIKEEIAEIALANKLQTEI